MRWVVTAFLFIIAAPDSCTNSAQGIVSLHNFFTFNLPSNGLYRDSAPDLHFWRPFILISQGQGRASVAKRSWEAEDGNSRLVRALCIRPDPFASPSSELSFLIGR
jgi:hypothetical protein